MRTTKNWIKSQKQKSPNRIKLAAPPKKLNFPGSMGQEGMCLPTPFAALLLRHPVSFRGNMRTYPHSGFRSGEHATLRSGGTSAKTTLLGKPPFCQEIKRHINLRNPQDTGRVFFVTPGGQTGVYRPVSQRFPVTHCRKIDRNTGRVSQGRLAVQAVFRKFM